MNHAPTRRSATGSLSERAGRGSTWALIALMLCAGAGYLAWLSSAGSAEGQARPGQAPDAARSAHEAASRVDPALRREGQVPADAGDLSDCSLLLVTLDTTRADRIGCYGNGAIRTPTLDRLAAQGILFSDVTAVGPTTLPAHTSILTGLYPWHHGVRANGLFRFDDERATLAERLREEGFRTGAVVSSFVLDGQFGLARGFEHYDDDLSGGHDPGMGHYREVDASRTTARALDWLGQREGERFFLWVHYFDPHHTYTPPPPFAAQYPDNPYDGEIAYVDAELGKLLAGLDEAGRTGSTLVAVVGDHGEGLGFHSEMTHSYLTYATTLAVPMILSAAGRLGGGVNCTRPASQVDVAPLLLALLGLSFREPRDGKELLDAAALERPIFFEAMAGALEFGWERLSGVSQGPYKYIHSSQPELYHRARDPGELTNRVLGEPEVALRLLGQLREAFGDDLATTAVPTLEPSQAELEQLQALGYLEAGTHPAGAPGVSGVPRPPQTMMPVLHRVAMANHDSKPLRQRIDELRTILQEHADFYPAWKALGDACRAAEDLDEAARALERCLELRPDTPATVADLALVRAGQGRLAQVVQLLEPVAAGYPSFVRARYQLGSALVQLGRTDEAILHLGAVFELDPDHERCVDYLIAAYQRAGRGAEVCGLLERHLTADPRATRVRLALAGLYGDLGQGERSRSLLSQGMLAAPDDPEMVRGAVLLLVNHPDPARRDPRAAIELLESFVAQAEAPPAGAIFTLSSLYASVERFDEALSAARRARDRARAEGEREVQAAAERQIARIEGR